MTRNPDGWISYTNTWALIFKQTTIDNTKVYRINTNSLIMSKCAATTAILGRLVISRQSCIGGIVFWH